MKGTRPDLAARNRGEGIRLYEDAEWCRYRYFEANRTFREIAEEASCSLRTIARWFRIHGIHVPSAVERRTERGTTLTGERHPNWKGGPRRCPNCGVTIAFHALVCQACCDRTGEANPKWRGDAIGIGQAHRRVRDLHGVAKGHSCAYCSEPAAHWAYDHKDPAQRIDPNDGPFSIKPEHYIPLCVKCHKRFDMAFLKASRVPSSEEPPCGTIAPLSLQFTTATLFLPH